ncbi:latent-transforming growth factor beta-binding protein 1-like, partial [Morone saxatilis]|uniref:latent-transforming growth factor beta-binding protein 1-like n=1 Tax=Morone saxatilis TaxID=34816 RepID=UPI0015E2236A
MAWIRWGLLFSFGLFLSPVRVSAEQLQSQSGFRRLYVLQPRPGLAGADGGVRISSISTRHGTAGQPHTYNVELAANYGGQVRNRRMGNQAASAPQSSQQQPAVRQSGPKQNQQKQLMKLSGVNVCGGQCCHGWSKAQGSQRCTKRKCAATPFNTFCYSSLHINTVPAKELQAPKSALTLRTLLFLINIINIE